LLALLAALGIPAAPASARAQDPAKINPRSYKVVLENEHVRVLEYLAKPGLGVCGVGRHSHPNHVTIALSGGRVKQRAEDGSVRIADAEPGKVFWAPAEVHEVENISGRNMRAYMIEIKDKDWKPSTG
jgi:quercetin dioxygenase-like cupin family protein